jgi:hypothetical protein
MSRKRDRRIRSVECTQAQASLSLLQALVAFPFYSCYHLVSYSFNGTMSDWWSSEAGLQTTGAVLDALAYVSIGAFLTDCICTASFDWSMLSGKRNRRWMHIFYFGAKVSLTIFLSLAIGAYWFTHKVDCHTLMYGLEFMMGMAVITSSALLAFRTIVINNCNGTRVPVKAILGVAGMGLIAAWMHGVADVSAIWVVSDVHLWTTGFCFPAQIKETYFGEYYVLHSSSLNEDAQFLPLFCFFYSQVRSHNCL